MPFVIRKVPKKELYWVVNKETGKKHSKEGLTKETAEAQRKALYASESGYKMKGKGIELNLLQQMVQSAYRGKTKLQIGPFKLLTSTPTLKFYKDDKRIIIAVRGTELQDKADLTADGLAIVGKLRDSERWKRDEAKVREVQEKFPQSEYRYIAVGHSLGGAIIDLMLRDNLIKTALSYNPLVEPQELRGNTKHRRIYHKDDPLYQAFGRFIPNVEVRTTAEPFWKYYLQYNLPFNLGELFKLYDRHRIARFRGGKKLEGGMTFEDIRRWLRTPANDNDPRTRTNADATAFILSALGSLAGSIYGANEANESGIAEGLGIPIVLAGTALGTGIAGIPLAIILNAIAGRAPPVGATPEQREQRGAIVDTISRLQNSLQSVGEFLREPRRERARQQQQAEVEAVVVNPMRNITRTRMANVIPRLPAEAVEAARAEQDFELEADVGNDRDGDGVRDVRTYNPFNLASLRAEVQGVEEEARPEIVAEALAEEGLSGKGREIVFEDQLQELEYPPKKYLAKVRARAKKAGYDPKKLSFCVDGVHKLQIETPDGKMVQFGRVGYGDFHIWSFLERNGKVEKGEAKKRRKAYLKRASAIKGDWKDNKYSANNLAIKILWK